jgi:hypothetical protein
VYRTPAFAGTLSMIETRIFYTSLEKDGYILTRVKPGSEILLQDAKDNTAAVIEVSGGIVLPLLVDLREIKSISKEARDHFSMRGRKPNVSAVAMLVRSPVSRIIGNFFIGFNHPVVPTRLFSMEKSAIDWVKRELLKMKTDQSQPM